MDLSPGDLVTHVQMTDLGIGEILTIEEPWIEVAWAGINNRSMLHKSHRLRLIYES